MCDARFGHMLLMKCVYFSLGMQKMSADESFSDPIFVNNKINGALERVYDC